MTRPIDNEEVLVRLNTLQSIIECGQHSGFLPCCIKFYVTEKIWMSITRRDNYAAKIDRREKELGREWNYIPCRVCLKNGIIVTSLPCPNGITCHPDDDREMANIITLEMQKQMSDIQIGFDAIKSGRVPIGGSVAGHVTHVIDKMNRLINK